MKHTQGQWTIHKLSDSFEPTAIVDKDGNAWVNLETYIGSGDKLICNVYMRTGKGGYPHVDNVIEAKANAALITAAPDMLAVLQELKESAAYWSEYDVPLGIVDRINAAIDKATGEAA